MKIKRVYGAAAAVALFGLSIAACGGGGGGYGGGGGGGGGPSPSPSPSICPSPNAGLPPCNTTTYTISGSSTQVLSRFAPTPTPPPLTTNSTISETAVVHTNQTFHGTNATDFKTTEIVAGPNQTLTTNSDIYLTFPASTGNVVDIGFHSVDSNGVTLDVQNLSGNGIIGQVPASSGWNNTAAAVIAETDPDGTTSTTTYNADGSYSLNKTEVAGNTTATENSNGSGSGQIPTNGFFGVGTATDLTISAPTGPVGTGTINYTFTAAGPGVPSPAPNTTIPVTAWYNPSPSLASDVTTLIGSTSIPAGCAAPALGTTGVQYQEVKTKLDTVFGFTDTETINNWLTTSAEPVCQTISDTLNLYYDFTGQLGAAVLSSTPLQTTTLTQRVGVQAVARADLARHPDGMRGAANPMAQQLLIATERVERFRQAVRERQLRALRELLKRRMYR